MRDRLNYLKVGEEGFEERQGAVLPAPSLDWAPIISAVSEGGSWCTVVTIQFRMIGYLPVIIDDGRVNVDALEYLHFLKEQNKSDSTINLRAIALRRFIDFYKLSMSKELERPIVREFFKALVHGYRELGWDSVDQRTARQYVESIALFLDYFSQAHGITSPNPIIEEPRTWASMVWERIRRYRSDPLYHLFIKTKRSTKRRRRLFLPSSKAYQVLSYEGRNKKKLFDLEEFIKLIEFEENPRNLLIWLLLGAGGLRESEVVHLFTSDITYDFAIFQAKILLAHPTYGIVEVENKRFTRQAYLQQRFGLVPRDQLPMYDIRWAGWKVSGVRTPSCGSLLWI